MMLKIFNNVFLLYTVWCYIIIEDLKVVFSHSELRIPVKL